MGTACALSAFFLFDGLGEEALAAIEQRLDDSGLSKDALIQENERNLLRCQENGCNYVLLDDVYALGLEDIVK